MPGTKKSRPKPHPTQQAPELRIPRPDHERIVIRFCGGSYPYVEPPRIRADVIRGHIMVALSKMQPTAQESVWRNAERIACATDINAEAARLNAEMTEAQKLALVGGGLVATPDMFEAVALALQLDPMARQVAENSYQSAELLQAFWLLAGAIMRPFGGTKSGTAKPSPTQTG